LFTQLIQNRIHLLCNIRIILFLEKFWKNSGKILEKFWKNSGKILEKFWKNSGKILEKFLNNS
jgi:hypothetical protein